MINDPFQMQRELRYGAPVCDQILTGRHFTLGYSWYFRQAKWALEIINPLRRDLIPREEIERMDNFRADTRIPNRFRASLNAYENSGYDRGHLVPSANHDLQEVFNSETFLLSNMSPQRPKFNRIVWKSLEDAVRNLDSKEETLETYVITCPVFYYKEKIETIGEDNQEFGTSIPIPHAFIKSVLSEDKRGRLSVWTFRVDNNDEYDGSDARNLERFLIPTYEAEQLIGGRFWDRISGRDFHEAKLEAGKMWVAPSARPKRTGFFMQRIRLKRDAKHRRNG